MVFFPPPSLPEIHLGLQESVPICDFMLDEKYGRQSLETSYDPYTCSVSGKTFSARAQRERVNNLARGLAREFDWQVNEGKDLDKVVAVFLPNTIDTMTLHWAIHRLNGVSTPVNASYSVAELTHQLIDSGAKFVFSCLPLLPVTLAAAKEASIPEQRIYICNLTSDKGDNGIEKHGQFKTLEGLVELGASLPEIELLRWEKGQGAKQIAFLCYSSGTSGVSKGVMISHFNVIANTLQAEAYDKRSRRTMLGSGQRDIVLGVLPQSHIYSLIVICHLSTYCGDQVIVLPKFEMKEYLLSIVKYKIRTLFVVPPMVVAMINGKASLGRYDLSSVRTIFTAAAPLGVETAEALHKQYPQWHILQAYGLTETCTTVCSTSAQDVWFGSSGCLIPGVRCRLVSVDGKDIDGYDEPGELLVSSPSVVLAYLNNEKATAETFFEDVHGRWMRTGDVAVVKRSPAGLEHIWIVDRIKELIKVKGFQVAPAELEAHLPTHPAVADCAVIPVPDKRSGELPKAFIVKSAEYKQLKNDDAIKVHINKYVEKHKAHYKRLAGGVDFIGTIPKSSSGKILRRLLRDRDVTTRRPKNAKM